MSLNSNNKQFKTDRRLTDLRNALYITDNDLIALRTLSPTQSDSFGRLRTADPYTIFDSTLRFHDDTSVWDTALTSGGTATHLPNESSVAMDVTGASGSKVIRESKRVFLYQPGKSQLCMNTFVFNAGKTGLRQRVGLFGEENGIFFEKDGDTVYICKRSYVTGTAVDIRVAQSSWNGDTLDGNGPSKVTIDWSKFQIMWLDIEWLGGGSVRVGLIVDGDFILAHTFHHANLITSVYMTSATLPIRYEIENTAATGSASRLKHVCNTVISEGGSTPRSTPTSVSTSLTGTNLSNLTYTPIIAIRLKSAEVDGVAIPVGINLYGLQNNAYRYAVYNNVTIPDGSWVSSGAESHVEYNITATSFSSGEKLLEGIFVGGSIGGPTDVDLRRYNGTLQLTRKINRTAEIFLVAVQATTVNDDCVASLVWEEYH